ncbi:hypothetical protein OPV22_011066 [Ensete ventricosum]|uniref:Secreted protein n=1 Tax=Ensete ventricosum TaxID=4639 RepID=A0AAV8PXG1_ENSVE|nr:hypothetical protein OPV22_011066 [Ensete ventricosum]
MPPCLLLYSVFGCSVVKLVAFHPFSFTLDAFNQCNAISEGLITEELRNFLEINFPNVKRKGRRQSSAFALRRRSLCQRFLRTRE